MKYIVTWFIIQMVTTSCPEPPPKYDEFGRVLNQSFGQNAMACTKLDSTQNRKYFDNADSAASFAKRGNELPHIKEHHTGATVLSAVDIYGPWFSDFKVDTLKRPYTR